MVTALRVLVTKDEKQEHEYESHGAFQVSEPRPLCSTRVSSFLTQEGGHKWRCAVDVHPTDTYVGRERLLQAGEVRPHQRCLLIFASLASCLTLGVGPTAGNSHAPPQ